LEHRGEIADLISTAERAALKPGWPMATTKGVVEREPSDLELLLPWHAAGTLSPADARRVEEALARDPELAGQHAMIREEYAAAISLNDNLGAPSVRATQKLFAAIDAQPAPDRSRLALIARLTPRFLRQRIR
jgi:anti-sigma factor RsiW